MRASSPTPITDLLQAWGRGDDRAFDRLASVVYPELRRIAHNHMRRERSDHTLQTTALVHEAFMRLVDARAVRWQDRAHFLAVASRMMRRVLVDAARSRRADKRGGRDVRVSIDRALGVAINPEVDVVALDLALDALEKIDARKSQVVELRFFGGLTLTETAAVLKVSEDTVTRDWKFVKVWLRREMRGVRRTS